MNSDDLIQTFMHNSIEQNLLLLLLYSLVLIVASSWSAHFAYRKGKGEKIGEIAAIAAKQDVIINHLSESTKAVQSITEELRYKFSVKGERRDRLEKVIRLTYQTLSQINAFRMSEIFIGGEEEAKLNSVRFHSNQIQVTIDELLTLARMYFSRVGEFTERYHQKIIDVVILLGERIADTPDDDDWADIRREIRSATENAAIYVDALLKEYRDECGISDND